MKIPNYVVIPFKGKIDMTWNLVQQLIAEDVVEQVILMDNDPLDVRYPWKDVPQHKCTTVSCPGKNLHTMWNQGIQIAVEDAVRRYPANGLSPKVNVAILNNDLILECDNYIEQLAVALRSDDNLAMVGGTPYEWHDVPTIFPAIAAQSHRGEAVMIKAEMPFRFDDRFEWWRGDDDIVAQIENAGYWVAVVSDAKHIHIDGGGQTAKEMDQEEFVAKVQRDTQRLYRKWPQMIPPHLHIPREMLMPR